MKIEDTVCLILNISGLVIAMIYGHHRFTEFEQTASMIKDWGY